MAGSPIGDASVRISADSSAFEGALSKITGLAAGAGAKISGSLGGAFAKVGAVLAPVAIVGGLVKIGATFDEAFDRIRVQTGATGQQFEKLQGSFKTVFADVPASADDVSTAVGTLSQKLGLTGAPLETLSKQVLDLSHITGTDLKGNLDATTGLFNNWGIAAGDQSGKLDELFRASQATGVSVGELASSMTSSGVVLRDVGLNFEQSASLIGVLGKAGLDAGAVMPALAKSLAVAAKSGKDAQTVFKDTFNAIKTAPTDTAAASAALAVFGARAGPRLAALIREGKLSYDDLAKSIASGGDTIAAATAATEDFPEKFKKFTHQAMVALEPLASAVFGFVGTLLEKLGPALQHVASLISDKVGPVVDIVVAGFKGMGAAFSGEGVTSSGFIGAMERIGVAAREVFDRIKAIDWAAVFAQAKDFIMPVVDALANVGRAVVDLAVAVAGFIADHWDQIKSAFETVADVARGALTTALTVLGGVIRTVADNFNVFGPAILAVVTAIVAYKAALGAVHTVQNIIKTGQQVYNTAIGVYHNLLKVGQAAQKAYTAAQWLLNAAMDANPITLIVIGIAALVAGFILAYKHIKPFHDAVNAIGRVIKEVALGAVHFFIDHWKLLLAILTGPIGIAVLLIVKHFNTIKNAVTAVVKWVGEKFIEFVGFFIELPGKILSALGDAASWLLQKGVDLITGLYNGVVSAAGTVIGWFTGLAGSVLGWIGDAASWLFNKGVDVLTGMYNGFMNFEATLGDYIRGFAGKIIGWIGDAGSWLFGVGQDIVQGLVHGLEAGWHWITDKISSLADALPGFAKSALGIGSPSKVFAEIGQNITQGLVVGIDQGASSVAARMTGLAGMVGNTSFGVGGGFGMPGGPGGGFRAGGGGSSVNNSRTWQAGAVQINIPAQGSPEATAMAVSRRLAMGVAA